MAASELKRNYDTRHCVFAISDENDIEMLPDAEKAGSGDLRLSGTCCQGSLAKTDDGKTYRLNGNNKWAKYSGGSGGGGGDDDAEPIEDADIDALFNI